MTKQIAIEDIEIDESLYPRSGGPAWQTIEAYRQAMESGSKFPPITVAPVNGKTVLIDGRHRLEATKKLKKKTILAEILKRMKPEEVFVEALKRNIENGLQLSFYDKMVAYKVLKEQGHAIKKICGILHIPMRKMRKYADERFTISTTGEEVALKRPLKHLGSQRKRMLHVEDQDELMGFDQGRLIDNLNTIIANGWLDKNDKKVIEGIERLKELLKVA